MKKFKISYIIALLCLCISLPTVMAVHNWDKLEQSVSISVEDTSSDFSRFKIHIHKKFFYSSELSQNIELSWNHQQEPQVISNDLYLAPMQTTSIFYKESEVFSCEESKLILCNTYTTRFSFWPIKKTSRDYIIITRNAYFPGTLHVELSETPEEKTVSLPMSIIVLIWLWASEIAFCTAVLWIIAHLIFKLTQKH